MSDKKIVLPGDLITDQRKKLTSNVYLQDNKIYSSVVGILHDSGDYVSVIALNGAYMPHEGDGIIAIVSEEVSNGYVLEYNSVSDIFIPKSKVRKSLKIGTVIYARIKEITVNDSIELDNMNVLPSGRIYQTSSVKVPRFIGKNESMLGLFKEYGNIVVGKNGWIWYNTDQPKLFERAFNLIVKNSQKSNLTNSVKDFLKNNKSD